MSIYSKVLFAINRELSPLLVMVMVLASLVPPAMGQRPLKHLPPVAARPLGQSRPISSAVNVRSSSTDFVPRAVGRTPVLNSDTQVVRASYEYDSAAAPIHAIEHPRAIEMPRASELPWSYELQNLSYEQFEAMLTEIWGARIRGKALDSDKRTIRIFIPDSKSSPEQTMKFDRVSKIATFEGAPNRKASWFKLMRDMDSSQDLRPGQVMRIIDIGNADQRLIRKVAYAVQRDQNPSGNQGGFAPFRQEQQPQTTELIDLSSSTLSQEERRRRLQELEPPVFPDGRKVDIIISGDVGTITLIGHPDDVAKLSEFINKLIEVQPALDPRSSEIIALNYQDPTALAEQLTEIYESQFSQFGIVTIQAIPVTRSILIVGAPGGVQQIADLARRMDVGRKTDGALTEDEKGFSTYQLKFISPFNAKSAVDQFFGIGSGNQVTTPGLEPQPVQTVVEERANRIVIYASPVLRKRAIAFLEEIDRPSSAEKNRRMIRVYGVRNQNATALAATVENILGQGIQQNFGSGNQQNNLNTNRGGGGFGTSQSLPQSGFTDLAIDGRNGRIGDGGRSFDVRFIPNDQSNTIAIVAYEETMPLILELIRQVDRIPDVASEVKVFPIFNGDANEILTTLNQIFTGETVAGGGQLQGGQGQAGQNGVQLPLQSPASDGTSLVNVRFGVNERLNVIIASGSRSEMEFVEALINRLDEPNARTRQTRVYRLSNASSADVSTSINAFLDALNTVNDANPQLGGGSVPSAVPRARRDVIVIEEAVSNSLIINAQPELFQEIELIIERLDRRPPVVKVKAMIVTVDLDQMENFGIDFGIQDSSIFEAGLSDVLGNGFVGLDNVSGQLLSDLGVGRAAPGGLVLSAGDESINFIMRFLETRGCAKVIFRPHVMTLENLTGRFTSGASIQRLGQINNVGLGTSQQSVDNVDVGVNLSVTPRVSPDGMIVMFVDVENTSLGNISDGTIIGIDAAGNPIQSAPINQTGVETAVMCRSGQTIAITGLISETKTENVSAIPILGKLPVVGPIFQSTQNSASRSETIIILTPYIVDGEDDFNFTNQDEFERMHWCRCDVAEAYGSTEYIGTPYSEQPVAIYHPDSDPRGENPTYNTSREPVQQQFPGRFDQGAASADNLGYADQEYRRPDSAYRNEAPQQNRLPYPVNDNSGPGNGREPKWSDIRVPAELPLPADGGASQNYRTYDRQYESALRELPRGMNDGRWDNRNGAGRQPYNQNHQTHTVNQNQLGADQYGNRQPSYQSDQMPRQFRNEGGRNFTLHPPKNQPSLYR